MRSSGSISTKLSISCRKATQQRVDVAWNYCNVIICGNQSRNLYITPVLWVLSPSLSVCISRKIRQIITWEPASSPSWSNQSIAQSNRSNTRRMSLRQSRNGFGFVAQWRTDDRSSDSRSRSTYPLPYLSATLHSFLFVSRPLFRVSSAQMRLVECAQIKVNELFLTSCFALSLLVISTTPLSPYPLASLSFLLYFCLSITFFLFVAEVKCNELAGQAVEKLWSIIINKK